MWAGLVLIAAAILAFFNMPAWAARFGTPAILCACGCLLVISGYFVKRRAFNAHVAKFSLIILTVAAVLTICELTFRVIGFDFNRFKKTHHEVPVYFRQATLHAGEGVRRRPGPMSWTGQVLRAYMRMHGTNDAPYANEQSIVADYDAQGFRNPMNLVDWEVVVTGDSFVELGYLPYDDLFTTVAGKRLGVRVKNLGVSGTGPISQSFYIQHYGKAASTKDAVLCFFEGNDVEDLKWEFWHRDQFRTNGLPEEFRPQHSVLKAAADALFGITAPPPLRFQIVPNAFLTSAVPARAMTVYGLTPGWEKLKFGEQYAVWLALKRFGNTARAMGMRPWVMYIPDSHRVFHGLVRYSNTNSLVARWQPADFAEGLGKFCAELDIHFINTYPTLRRDAEAGLAPYNLIGDTHLSREGSRAVANVLADSLKSAQGR